jgi:hypothetical protein
MALNFNKKVASVGGAVLLVIGLVSSGFVIEDRYANEKDVEVGLTHEREVTDLHFKNFEEQVVMNLKQLQVQQDYRYYMSMLENVDTQIYKIKQWLREHPNDQEAKEDYQNLKNKRNEIKQRLDELMRK